MDSFPNTAKSKSTSVRPLSKKIITVTSSEDSDSLSSISKAKATSASPLGKIIITVTSSDDSDGLPDVTNSKAAVASPPSKRIITVTSSNDSDSLPDITKSKAARTEKNVFVVNNSKLSISLISLNAFENKNFTATDNDANRCGKLKRQVMMSIAELMEKLENFSATPLAAIPDGIESYKYYIIDNSRNNTTKGPRLHRDNYGAWRGSRHNALYMKQSSKQQLQKLFYLIKIKKINTSAETIPTQPGNKDVISLYKYNCYSKSDKNYKRRVIVESSKPNIALMVEYCGNFAGSIKPYGQTEFSATTVPYIRTKITDRIKKTLHKKTDDILMQTMASDGIFEV